MPTQDEIIQEIYKAVSTGAGVDLTAEEQSGLHKRYYDWIANKKKGATTSPQDIWGTADGDRLKKQFEKIGREMAHHKTHSMAAACATVERLSECPHCPDPTG